MNAEGVLKVIRACE